MDSITHIIKKLRENRILSERKDYESYDTVELVDMAQRGDQLAIETLIKKYKDHIRNMTKKYFINGSDDDDVLQIATIGFWEAIMSWDKSGSFEAYSGMIMKRKLLSEIDKAEAEKSKIHRNAQSTSDTINNDGEGGEQTLGDIIPDKGDSPEDLAIAKELQRSIEEYIEKNFTAQEREVLRMSVDGYKKMEIAEELGLNYKKVDNIIYKMKFWLKNHIKDNFSESRKIRRDEDREFSDEEKKMLESALTNIRKREKIKTQAATLREAYDNYTEEQLEKELDVIDTELDHIEHSLRDRDQEELNELYYDLDDLHFRLIGMEDFLTEEQTKLRNDLEQRIFMIRNQVDDILERLPKMDPYKYNGVHPSDFY